MIALNGASALGIDDATFARAGQQGPDSVAPDRHNARPLNDVSSQMVDPASSHQVAHVWVAGRTVIQDGCALSPDSAVILTNACSCV